MSRLNYSNNKKRHLKLVKKWHLENPDKAKESHKKANDKFRKEKRKRFNNLMMDAYYRNKGRWKERGFTKQHREKLLKLLPNKCFKCGNSQIKQIHHIEYGNKPKLISGRNYIKYNEKLLKKYCKYLLVFCSKQCHIDHEKNI